MDRKECLQGIRKGLSSLSELLDELINEHPEGGGSEQASAPVQNKDYSEWPSMKPSEPKVTLEDVRAVLAEKASSGFRTQVRAILNLHGAEKLSEINEELYPLIKKQGEGIELFDEILRALEALKADRHEDQLPGLLDHHYAKSLSDLCPDYYGSFLRDLKELSHAE